MSYEKDKLDSYVTSGSLSATLANYVTSNSLSAAIAGISLSGYVTSDSLSAAVATNTLTVRGAASVSATLSAAAVTVNGRPIGPTLIEIKSGTTTRGFSFSGSWSDFAILHLHVHYRNTGGVIPVTIYTDGGTTPILANPLNAAVVAGQSVAIDCRVFGIAGIESKCITATAVTTGSGIIVAATDTANAGVVNCVRISATQTASFVYAALYGWRNA